MKRWLQLMLLVMLVVSACGGGLGSDLDDAEQLWHDSGIVDYRLKVTNSCFCLSEYVGPFDVIVVEGEIVEVRRDGDLVDVEESRVPAHLFTVDRIFSYIRSKLDVDEISVTFAEEGNPTHISIDHTIDAVDDEVGITIELMTG